MNQTPTPHSQRSVITLTAILLAAMLGFGVWHISAHHRTKRDELNTRQRVYAVALAEHADRALGEVRQILDRIEDDLRQQGRHQKLSEQVLQDIFRQRTQNVPQVGSVFLTNADGMVQGTSLGPLTKPISLADRDYFQYHRNNPSAATYYSRPFLSKYDNTWRFSVSCRLNRPDGSFNGILGIALPVSYFQEFYQRLQPLPSERISLIRLDGYLLLSLPTDGNAYQINLADSELFTSQLPRQPSGTFSGRLLSHDQTRQISYHQLQNSPLVASISVSPSEASAGWRSHALGVVAIMLFSAALIIWLATRLARQLKTAHLELERQVAERTSDLANTSHDLAINQARLQALLDINHFPAEDTQQLLDFALQKVLEITSSRFGYIYHYHEDRQEFVLNSWSKEVMPACSVTDPQSIYQLEKTGIWGEAVRQRKPIVLNDFGEPHPLKKGYPDGHVHLTRFLTLPIIDENQKIVAVVGVANKEQPYFDEDIQQLDLMTTEVWRIVKRQELEQKVINAGHEWQLTFDAISDSICLLDADQRILRCNRASLGLFGKDFSSSIGRHCCQLVHGSDVPLAACPMQRAKQSHTTESQLFFEKGRWLQITVNPLLDDQGTLTGAVHIVRDDTDRIAGEQSLRELLSMLEAVQNELYVFNTETLLFEYVNASAQQNLGYSQEQLLQMTPCDLKRYSRHEFVRLIAPLLTGATKLLRFESTHWRADGSCYPIEVNLQLVETHNGKRCLAVNHDIGARKQAEDSKSAALQQAQRFRTALDYVNAFIYIKDLESRYIYANMPCLEVFHCTAEDLPGSPDSRFFPPETVERLRQVDQQVFRGERTTEEIQTPLPDGTIRIYLEVKTPIYADSSKDLITGLLGISTDITQFKQAEQQLRDLQTQLLQNEKLASIGQLSAGIAHEINNPMGFINSNLSTMSKYVEKFHSYIGLLEELLQQHATTDAWQTATAVKRNLKLDYVLRDVDQLIEESCEGAERVMKIVQDLKTFSRSDTAQVSKADINQNLDSTINIIWNQIKYVAELVRDYGVLPKLQCNIQQLNQVFLNLLVNAAHAIEDRGLEEIGTITVRTWAADEQLYITISDTGCGIPEEISRRIFEPFFTTKDIGKGTGLGLSISHEIIRKHGGELSVTSQVGCGTTFTIRLPLQGDTNGASTGS